MTKKKLTLTEAKEQAGNRNMHIYMNVDATGQEAFDNRSDKRITFPMLVALTANRAKAGTWKGDLREIDGEQKFVVNITEARMAELLAEGEKQRQDVPMSATRADQRMKGIKSFMRALIAKYGEHVDFDPMKLTYDEALEEMDEMLLQDGGKEVYDFRPIVNKAQSAADAACDAVIASLQEHLKEVMERAGKARLYDRVIENLSDDRRDRLGELQRNLGKFFQFIPSQRRQEMPRATTKRTVRRPVSKDRNGIPDISNVDLHQEFVGKMEAVSNY